MSRVSKLNIDSNTVLYYPYESWINSQLSIARYYGGVTINGQMYAIAKDNSLVHSKLLMLYEKYGREKLVEAVSNCIEKTGELTYKGLSEFCKAQVSSPKEDAAQGELF